MLSVQVLPSAQFALQDSVQEPVQVFWERQASEALAPALPPSAGPPPQVQLAPCWQVQAGPEQAHAGPGQAEPALVWPPHAQRESARNRRTLFM